MRQIKEIKIALISPNDVDDEIKEIKDYFNDLKKTLENKIYLNVNHWLDTPEGMISKGQILQDKIEETLDFENSDIVICVFGYTLGTKIDNKYRTEKEMDKVIELYLKNSKPEAFVYFKNYNHEKEMKKLLGNTGILEEFNKVKNKWNDKLNYTDFNSEKDLISKINNRFIKFLFLENTNELNLSSKEFKIMLSIDEYLEQLAYLISIAENEVYYTSTKMASTTDSRYGEKQKLIIENAIKFKDKYPNREHFGIIDSEDSTIVGSIELRRKIDDIVLKFHEKLNTIGFNFFISDNKHIVIKFNDKQYGKEFSIYTVNRDLNERFKQYFYDLWHDSKTMKEHLNYKQNDKLINIFKDMGLGSSIFEIDSFFNALDSIDQINSPLPYYTINGISNKNIFIKDVFPYSSNYQFDKTLELYASYIDSYFINNLISLETIKAVRKSIIEDTPIDYSKYSETFFYMFFIANYMKTIHSLELIKSYLKSKNLKILDIGGGGGASFLATQNFLDSHNISCIQLDIVDNSNKQLEISKKFNNNKLPVYYECIDINTYLDNIDIKYDLIIVSNSLCEITTCKMILLLGKIKSSLSEDGLLLTIERVESGVYDKILSQKTDFMQLSYVYKNERYRMNESLYGIDTVLENNSMMNLKNYIKTGYTLRYGLYK